MVAGACGIDFALLVVAADDGVMPQTREHIAILELLGVAAGAVALTKIDRVAAARLRSVEQQVAAALAATALAGAPIFPVNATAADDPSTIALRQHLHAVAMRCAPRADHGPFRLAVDRVFSLAGHGTIVTGTVFSGRAHSGNILVALPAGHLVRVRAIHAQNRAAEAAGAGERCALNLVGVERGQLARGDWIAEQHAMTASTRLDVRLKLLADSSAQLETWSPLHLHLGTARSAAHLALLESTAIAAGGSARAQLVLQKPICALAGDRFIVRDAQGRHTIGGGHVLDPCAPARRRRSAERLGFLGAIERLLAGEGIAPLLEQARFGMSVGELVRLTGHRAGTLAVPAAALTISAGDERYLVPPARWQELRARLLHALARFHEQVPDEPGPDPGRLRRMSSPEMPVSLWRALLEELVREGAVQRNGAWLHLPQHRLTLSAADEALLRRLRPLIAAGRYDPPWVRELAASVHEPEDRVRTLLRKHVAQCGVYQVVRDLFYDRERIGELAAIVAELSRAHGTVSAARFRDALGLGRKRAIQILEFFDRVGYTRRVKDTHVLRADSAWRSAAGLAPVPHSGTVGNADDTWKAPVPGGATGLQTQEGAPDASW
jgi:selenocysteine-specific elongation factor